MFKLLVVEDQADFYEDYLLRLFQKLLPMEKISITHVPTLASALGALQEPWDFILMDYSLGAKIDFWGSPIKNGADLTTFRRAIEAQEKQPPAYILGTSSNEVGNQFMLKQGATGALLKLKVPKMAQRIREVLKAHG